MIKYFLAILGVILLLAFIREETRPEMTKLTKKETILAFGDSITYGFGANPKDSYPSKLSNLMPQNIINAGVNGDTSEDGLNRLPQLIENNDIQLILLWFGGNDILQKIPQQTIKANLKKMISLAKEKNIEVILISVPNVSLFGLDPLELYEEISKEEDVELIEGLLSHVLSTQSLKSDYIHPNKLGYEYIANKIHIHLTSNHWITKE